MWAAALPALMGFLSSSVGAFVTRALIALGIGYVTYKGFDLGITWLLNSIKDSIAGMPAEVVGFLGYLWVDKAIAMIFSAYSAALAVKMAGGAGVTKMITKTPT